MYVFGGSDKSEARVAERVAMSAAVMGEDRVLLLCFFSLGV
jgi:hypothetical protein